MFWVIFFIVILGDFVSADCSGTPTLVDSSGSTGWIADRLEKSGKLERNQECRWQLKGPSESLSFFEFQFTQREYCPSYDSLSLYEWRGDDSGNRRLVWHYKGTSSSIKIPSSVEPSADANVELVFKTGSSCSYSGSYDKGFNVTWTLQTRSCPRRIVRSNELALTMEPSDFVDGAVCETLWSPASADFDAVRFYFSKLQMREPNLDFVLVHSGPHLSDVVVFQWPEPDGYALNVVSDQVGGNHDRQYYLVEEQEMLIEVRMASSPQNAPPADFGFALHGFLHTRRSCQGMQRLSLGKGWFEDGSTPLLKYWTPADCWWDIFPDDEPDFDYIEATVVRLDRYYSSHSLRMYDGAPASDDLARDGTGVLMTNLASGDTVVSSGRRLRIRWLATTTTESLARTGWTMTYRTLKRTCPTTYFSNVRRVIVSNPGSQQASGGYAPNDDCLYMVTFDPDLFAADGVYLSVSVPLFTLRTDEYLTLYSGPTTQSPQLIQWSKVNRPATTGSAAEYSFEIPIDMTDPVVLIRFQASSVPESQEQIDQGFAVHLELRQPGCAQSSLYTGQSGFFSDGYPPFQSPPDSECNFVIRPDSAGPNDFLALSLVEYKQYSSSSYLEIFDTASLHENDNHLIQRVRQTTSCPIVTPGPEAVVRYYTRNYGSTNLFGFEMQYTVVKRAHPLTKLNGAQLGSGVISVSSYEPGDRFEWLLDLSSAPAGWVEFRFESIHIRPNFQDVVEVFNGASAQATLELQASADNNRAAGDLSTFVRRIDHYQSSLFIQFVAANGAVPPTQGFTGFRLHWRLVANDRIPVGSDLVCSDSDVNPVVVTAEHGFLQQHGDHRELLKGKHCSWTVRAPASAPPNAYWKLRLTDIDLGSSTYDWVRVYQGDQQQNAVTGGPIASLSQLAYWRNSQTTPTEIISNSSSFSVQAYTTTYTVNSNRKGWKLDYFLCVNDQCAAEIQLLREAQLPTLIKFGLGVSSSDAVDKGCPVSHDAIELPSLPPFTGDQPGTGPTPEPPSPSECTKGAAGCPCRTEVAPPCDGGGSLVCSSDSGLCESRCSVVPGSAGCPCSGGDSGQQQCSQGLICDNTIGCVRPSAQTGDVGGACLAGGQCNAPGSGAPSDAKLECRGSICVLVGDDAQPLPCGGGPGCRCETSEPKCQSGLDCIGGSHCAEKQCVPGNLGCGCLEGGTCAAGFQCAQSGTAGVASTCVARQGCEGDLNCSCAPGNKCFSPYRCDLEQNACVPTPPPTPPSGPDNCPVGLFGCKCAPTSPRCEELLQCNPSLLCELDEQAVKDQLSSQADGASGNAIGGVLIAVIAVLGGLIGLICCVVVVWFFLSQSSSRAKPPAPAPVSMRSGNAPSQRRSGRSRRITRTRSAQII